MRTLSLRAIFIIGFVIVMPLLALPAVARRLDDWLYGPPPQSTPHARLRKELAPVLESAAAEGVSPASYDEIDVPRDAKRDPQAGLDGLATSPPPLDPLPAFDRLATGESGGGTGEASAQLDNATAARLARIRRELELLGAEYILLETTDGSGTYRFHCQMRVSDEAPYTREFEATAGEPLAAAERVLGEVSAWCTASRGQKLR
jgi:hypothetical protein